MPKGPVREGGDRQPPAKASPAAFDLDRTKEALSREIKELLEDTGIPSISIALLKGDRVVWAEAFGYLNVKLKVPASPGTIYCTGSCFKPITAMAVLQLADRGKLKLDDPINNHLGGHAIKDMSAQGKPITVRHLLAHYSGLPAKHASLPLWGRKAPQSLEELAGQVKPEKAPGVTYEYSNANYALAGLIIQEVSGKSYERYLIDELLRPLGVEVAGPVNPTPAMIEELSLPYRLEDRKALPEVLHRFDVYPAGELYLSAPDVARVLLTHLNEGRHNGVRLLSKAAVEEMRRPQFGGKDGLDFGIKTVAGEKLIMHGGGVPGYSTKFVLAIDAGVGVYVASNAGNVRMPMDLLAALAIDLLRGKEVGSGLVRETVGVGTALAIDEKAGLVRITEVIPKSPASRAGLSGGLVIRKVNGVPVAGKTLQECLELMGGPVGTKVRLELVKPGGEETTTVELTRQRIRVPG
jgi:CubicO group peptidase (beta-lactamase class C family)